MWTKTFDFSKRHCNRVETPNGTGYAVNGQFDVLCSNPQDHPYAVGAPEYLRWIRFFGKRVGPGITYGDGEDIPLTLGTDKMVDGREGYCENYGGRVKAFLFNDLGYVIVEVHDETLIEAAREAVEDTEMSYAEEFGEYIGV